MTFVDGIALGAIITACIAVVLVLVAHTILFPGVF